MIEKPDLEDAALIARLQEEFGLQITQLTFLPLGWDMNTAVYRAVTHQGAANFLKLRKGDFNEIAVRLPAFLHEQAIQAVISPLETMQGRLWGRLEPYRMILYPFIEGRDGYETDLNEGQWHTFGAALRSIHAVRVPIDMAMRIPSERYSDHWRELALRFLRQVEEEEFRDPIAAKTAALLHERREEIAGMAQHTRRLADRLRSHAPALVLCHNDIHPGNLHISAEGKVYIVDWDEPVFAPRERDLALIGGSRTWSKEQDTRSFYQGYGPAPLDPVGLAYYRRERILVDIAEFCKQLLLETGSEENREQSYQFLTGIFQPGGDLEIAEKREQEEK